MALNLDSAPHWYAICCKWRI